MKIHASILLALALTFLGCDAEPDTDVDLRSGSGICDLEVDSTGELVPSSSTTACPPGDYGWVATNVDGEVEVHLGLDENEASRITLTLTTPPPPPPPPCTCPE